ncbi:MAG: linear amide C-N hydrolase [Microthrixaceae bacterium]
MCTSLQYTDTNGSAYFGRTLELDVDEPWVMAYVPPGMKFESQAPDHPTFTYTSKFGFVAVTAPARMPTKDEPLTQNDLKVIEGMNSEGVTFSLLAYPSVGDPGEAAANTIAAIQAWDLGSWVLSQCSTVAEVKEELAKETVYLTKIALVGNSVFPFHLVVHDQSGASIVIEWKDGVEHVYDNPVGVMTNGPTFPWHLTNLGNWTHLTNVDQSGATFGSLDVRQPDAGIATATLPSDNTSVGRFIRAVFYANFVEKVDDADAALTTLSRIMDNFDRPRGATTSPPDGAGGEGVKFQGIGGDSGPPSEYTVWTNLADLSRKKFLFRSYGAFNWSSFDLAALEAADAPRAILTSQLDTMGGDATQTLLAGMGL